MEYDQILTTCLELEGLLCLVEKRGSSDKLSSLILKKTELLYDSVRENFTAVAAEADEEAVATSVLAEEEADADVDLENPDSVEVVSLPTVELTQADSESAETVEADAPEVAEEKHAEEKPAQKETAAVRNDTVNVEFTINDKFRFRRELFSNSDVDMSDALQIASRMNSREELEDYFYNDLCLDPENPVVKDFMRIIGHRFN